MDVYDLSPARIGQFDIVLFLGVLYHLKHPLLALERVCSVTKDLAAVDSFVLRDAGERALLEFYETNELGGQTDNWVGPSLPCLLAFCRTAGFARVEFQTLLEYGACVACYRSWDESKLRQAGEPPRLLSAFHHRNFGLNFESRLDEYVTSCFEWPETPLTLDDVQPEVDDFGTRPLHVGRKDDEWQVTYKLPPGLKPGWHSVHLRVNNSPRSNGVAIATDLPVTTDSIAIHSYFDASTWQAGQIDLRAGSALTLWIEGLPQNADRNNVEVYLANQRIPVNFVEPGSTPVPRQVNAILPQTWAAEGDAELWVSVGGRRSGPVAVRVLGP